VRKVLLIVEGKRAERVFFSSYFNKVGSRDEVAFYSYQTDAIKLYHELIELGDDEDLLTLLRTEKDNSAQDKETLANSFTDVFLVFDLDYHIPTCEDKKKVYSYFSAHFCESTDEGLFFVNSPMMESFRDMKTFNDASFLTKTIKAKESASYKEIVNKRGNCRDVSKFSENDFYALTIQNIKRANNLLKKDISLPTFGALKGFTTDKIVENIFSSIDLCDEIPVINTSIFIVPLYYGLPFCRACLGMAP